MTTKKWKCASVTPPQRCVKIAEQVTRPSAPIDARPRGFSRREAPEIAQMKIGSVSSRLWRSG